MIVAFAYYICNKGSDVKRNSMSKLSTWYISASETKRNVFVLFCVAIVGFASLCLFFLLGNPGIPLGWLLGSLVGMLCYLSNVFGAKNLTGDAANPKGKGVAITVGLFFLRFALIIGALVLSAMCTFKWKNSMLSIWSVGAGYFPMVIVLAIGAIASDRRYKKLEEEAIENQEEGK